MPRLLHFSLPLQSRETRRPPPRAASAATPTIVQFLADVKTLAERDTIALAHIINHTHRLAADVRTRRKRRRR